MILSASRRTDIPAFFSDWFMNRLRDGYLLVRNPMNYHQVSKIELSPAVLDCIVFWTKNPRPLLPYLAEISESYPFYFQYTLNAYGKDIEQNLPDVGERVRTAGAVRCRVLLRLVLARHGAGKGKWFRIVALSKIERGPVPEDAEAARRPLAGAARGRTARSRSARRRGWPGPSCACRRAS